MFLAEKYFFCLQSDRVKAINLSTTVTPFREVTKKNIKVGTEHYRGAIRAAAKCASAPAEIRQWVRRIRP